MMDPNWRRRRRIAAGIVAASLPWWFWQPGHGGHHHPAPPKPTPTATSTPTPRPTPTVTPTQTPTPTPTPSQTVSPSGIPDFAGYTRVIGEDFTKAAAVGSFASAYPGWAGYDGNTSGASGTTWNSKTTMSVADSQLRMRNWVSNGVPQAGALTPLVPGTGQWYEQKQLYGKYAVRFRSESVKGFKVAWLLWPSSSNWSDGEIDFPEANLDGAIGYSSHNVAGDPEDQQYGFTSTRMADGAWHTAVTTWERGKITFELDGKVIATQTNPTFIPTKPMRWDLQNEVSTDGTRPAANADGSVYIDWVAQYAAR